MPESRPPRRWPPPQGWHGFDTHTTCNLCGIWRPSLHSDERLLEIEDFDKFVFTASLYRTIEEGRVLVAKWARRHGGEVEQLLLDAALPLRPRSGDVIAAERRERERIAAEIEREEREEWEWESARTPNRPRGRPGRPSRGGDEPPFVVPELREGAARPVGRRPQPARFPGRATVVTVTTIRVLSGRRAASRPLASAIDDH